MGRTKLTTKSDINIPFVLSPYCKQGFIEHRRMETCTELKGDKVYHAIGICAVCGGVKKYKHIDLSQYGSITQPSKQRDYVLFHNKKPEYRTNLIRTVGGR